MCRSRDKLLFLLFFFLSLKAFSQTSTVSNPLSERLNSPYTRYGIGEPEDADNTAIRGMGHATSTYCNPFQVNADNPATYPYLRLITYEAGFQAVSMTIATSSVSSGTGTASISYMDIGIPINKHFGIAFGFRPNSRVYYNLVDTPNTNIGKTAREYSGSGSTDFAFLGLGAKFGKFSLGVNGGYMFGTIFRAVSVLDINNDTLPAYDAHFLDEDKIGGLYWKAGALYQDSFGKDKSYVLSIGGTYTMKQNVNLWQSQYRIASYSFIDTTVQDTLNAVSQARSHLTLPSSISIGISLAKGNKWAIAADYTATNWSEFHSTDSQMTSNIGSTSYRASLGGQYTPDAENAHNFWSRTTYKLGVYYGTDYLKISNNTIPYYGLTFGGTIPFKGTFGFIRSIGALHTSVDVGRLGTVSNGLIQETYVKFSIGASFNAAAPGKRRYE
jgi:hypothetical protein